MSHVRNALIDLVTYLKMHYSMSIGNLEKEQPVLITQISLIFTGLRIVEYRGRGA